ncbi:MAG: helix-turn-helix transcriptional regulator [Verrucomicrobia bacterium]|nr:helix-turn-helix transcriptional regulator [Verrucomicrobiota bacterium]
MEAHLNQKLTVAELARIAHLAPARLHQLFRAETSKSPLQYINALRMRRAKDLVETTLHSVKEIAAEVGINDVSHFVRKFELTWGLPPSRYRSVFHREYENAGARQSEKMPINYSSGQ